MAKYTREQIEGKLTQVFDSVMQTKDVELSESAEITPDEGYLGLKKVNVSVKGGGGSVSSWKYFDVSAFDDAYKGACVEVGMIVKTSDGSIMPIGTLAASKDFALIVAFSIDEKVNISVDGQIVPFSVIWEAYGPQFLQMGAVEITEEEFYTL